MERKALDHAFVHSLHGLLHDPELVYRLLDVIPIPIEIFAPDGTTMFWNKAGMELNNIQDLSLVIGKYNLLHDPVCNDQMGMREEIQKAFRGEPVVVYDVNAPLDDLVDRGLVREKPFEKSCMDFHLLPVMDNGKLAFVVFVCIVKSIYQGRPEVAKAKEYIDKNWQEELIPEEMAKAVGMGVSQLYVIFKQDTGMTPGAYHKRIKVEHIKVKLADKSLTIKEAFTACGADSRGRIARVFKGITGMTPKQYREYYNTGKNKKP